MPTFCQGRSKIRPGQDAEGKNRSYCSPESKEANRGVNPRRKQPALISSSPRLAQDRPIEMAAKPETLTDKQSALKISSTSEKQKFYREVASAAESGWDFSTRWMR
ncbi:putative trehalase [Morella rubra]|uniref:Trehalase n=1 Tax=Morella rubra TaxID=262757 RepID=A0A6A1VVD3_9ROSI|nr:putative trehalase [Morella rubra]